ncbi:ABC transporter ATP-binding protein [Desulfonatronovibrio hydrogenovorans]|uniref:ABC transporter ATP-binding protein n=1 Tax=Desulfonatronovibrio hydrogenovorans TaxID=53245 RepID=UPI001FC9F794|nr:ABC transporter ATP-binding protein [Desulfonatronovibrio hydrogenovorans]
MSLIAMKQIFKSYQMGPVKVSVLNGVDLEVRAGELLAIVGTSGCGKSTLMNIMGFLDLPDSGRYLLNGQETSALSDRELSTIRNQKIGFVFQQFNLLPKLTALENVCLPLIYRGVREKEQVEKARENLALVDMDDRRHHKPSELSGGQQQRVAIARALCGQPAIILADEPTGALDTRVGQDIMDLFLQLNRQKKVTMVIITHDPKIAAQCQRKVHMQDGTVKDRAGSAA